MLHMLNFLHHFGCSVLHQARVHKVDPKDCPLPCTKNAGCHTAVAGEHCYSAVKWVTWHRKLKVVKWDLKYKSLTYLRPVVFFCSGCAFFLGGGGNAFGDGDFRRPLKNQSKNNYHRTLFESQEFGGWKMCFCVFFFLGGGGGPCWLCWLTVVRGH